MKLLKTKTPNSRLLFKESLDDGEDWYLISHEIDCYIENHGKFQLANGETIIYFFAASQDELFCEENVWVGKEVIGSSQIEEEDLDLTDLEAGFCWSQGIDLEKIETWQGIFELEKELRQSSSLNLAENWRIRIPYPQKLRYAKIEFYEADQDDI